MICPKCNSLNEPCSVKQSKGEWLVFYSCGKCGHQYHNIDHDPPKDICLIHQWLVMDVREIDGQIHTMSHCPRCLLINVDVSYKFPRGVGHKCQWEHIGTRLVDGFNMHEIDHIDRCDLCGAIREIPRDTRRSGLSGRIEIDDPRVKRDLLFNKSSWLRNIPKEIQELGKPPESNIPILPREV